MGYSFNEEAAKEAIATLKKNGTEVDIERTEFTCEDWGVGEAYYCAVREATICPSESGSGLILTIHNMYEYFPVTYKSLEFISQVFKTDKINIVGREGSPGCDTCDYGSQYTVKFVIFGDGLGIIQSNE